MIMKYCKCGNKIPVTVKQCDECIAKQQKNYDTYHRKNYDIYHDKRWIKLKDVCKSMFNGIDIYAYYKLGKIIPGDIAHHIIEVNENIDLAFEIKNLLLVSDRSHKEIHKRYGREDKKKVQKELFEMIQEWKNFCRG